MTDLLLLFAASATLAAILANIGIWSARSLWVKLSAIAAIALFLPATYGALAELLSRPKPVSIEWAQRAVPEAVVLGSNMIEDEAIYLWLGFEGQDEPRAYVLPWSDNLARQLHKAQQEADADGQKLKMRKPFEKGLDQMEQVFYPEPRDAPPPKQVSQGEGPVEFQGTTSGTVN